MKFTQFVQQYLANNKNSGLTYREAMKDDGVRCAYKQFEADLCKKGVVRKPEKRPEPKKRYNKDTGCGDNVINQYIDNNSKPSWSPPPTGAPPQPPSQRPGFPPPPPTAPKGSYQHDPFQQMAQDPYWQRNPALLEQARRQYEQAQAEAQRVRDTAQREEQPVREFVEPPDSIPESVDVVSRTPDSLMDARNVYDSFFSAEPPTSTLDSNGEELSSIYSAPSGLSGTTDNFILDQTMIPEVGRQPERRPPVRIRVDEDGDDSTGVSKLSEDYLRPPLTKKPVRVQMDDDYSTVFTQDEKENRPKRQYRERSTGIDLRNKPTTPLEQRTYIRNTEVPRIPPPLMSEGVQAVRDRTLVRLQDVPEQELYEIIDEELMKSKSAVDREKVMEELRKAKEDSTAFSGVQKELKPGAEIRRRYGSPVQTTGVRFTDEEEATKLITEVADIVIDEVMKGEGKWTSLLGSVPETILELAEKKRRKEAKKKGKDRQTREKEYLDNMYSTFERYGTVLKAAMERVAEDARQSRQREAEAAAERKVRRQEKKKTSKGRRDGGEDEFADDALDARKKPRFGTREYRQELRQRIREGVNRHINEPPSRGVRPISETMQYRPDVPFAYNYRPRVVTPEEITRSTMSGVRRDRARLGMNERNEDMDIEGTGMGRKDKLKGLISALIDVI